jgi:hypothetical protein
MSFFGGGSSSAPTPPPPTLPEPLPSPASFASGGNKARPSGRSGAMGYGSTLMTSGEGVDSSETNLQRKSLLGQ